MRIPKFINSMKILCFLVIDTIKLWLKIFLYCCIFGTKKNLLARKFGIFLYSLNFELYIILINSKMARKNRASYYGL